MLKAIATSAAGAMTLNIDSGEYEIDCVPDGLLTQPELDQVREIAPNALQGYAVYQEHIDEPHQL